PERHHGSELLQPHRPLRDLQSRGHINPETAWREDAIDGSREANSHARIHGGAARVSARCAARRGAKVPGGKIFFTRIFRGQMRHPSKHVAPLVTLARSAPVICRWANAH